MSTNKNKHVLKEYLVKLRCIVVVVVVVIVALVGVIVKVLLYLIFVEKIWMRFINEILTSIFEKKKIYYYLQLLYYYLKCK